MAFKTTLKDWISIFFAKESTESTLSIAVNKKFSEVKAYIENGKFGSSLSGKMTRQTDNGFIYRYEYDLGQGKYYRVTVDHRGEKATKVELFKRCPAALAISKGNLNDFEKKVADIPEDEVVVEEVKPEVDYAAKELNELVDLFDENLNVFKKNATIQNLNQLDKIKEAMSDKINLKPLAQRGNFNKPLGEISMYIEALKMQMTGPNPMQFVGIYVPKMEAMLGELAALLEE
ncbi:MAG: hypothetical protein IJX88_05135 [Clostridia bacterium]|nr:hypothetical protein [Clostridia bacterium]